MNKGLDVIVLFYTSNPCKLCEDIWPFYIQAAKVLHRTQDLRFTSIDMGQNELAELHNIFYYPTIRYFPRDSKHRPYDYDAGLSMEDIIEFVKRVSSLSLVEDYSIIENEITK